MEIRPIGSKETHGQPGVEVVVESVVVKKLWWGRQSWMGKGDARAAGRGGGGRVIIEVMVGSAVVDGEKEEKICANKAKRLINLASREMPNNQMGQLT